MTCPGTGAEGYVPCLGIKAGNWEKLLLIFVLVCDNRKLNVPGRQRATWKQNNLLMVRMVAG